MSMETQVPPRPEMDNLAEERLPRAIGATVFEKLAEEVMPLEANGTSYTTRLGDGQTVPDRD